jgi:hypothetical protein
MKIKQLTLADRLTVSQVIILAILYRDTDQVMTTHGAIHAEVERMYGGHRQFAQVSKGIARMIGRGLISHDDDTGLYAITKNGRRVIEIMKDL